MKSQRMILPVLALATAAFSTLPGAAIADGDAFNRFNDRTTFVLDGARPYQHQSMASNAEALTNRFNDRTSHVRDSERPYQRLPAAVPSGNEVVAREILTNQFNDRTTHILDSARAYQQRSAIARR